MRSEGGTEHAGVDQHRQRRQNGQQQNQLGGGRGGDGLVETAAQALVLPGSNERRLRRRRVRRLHHSLSREVLRLVGNARRRRRSWDAVVLLEPQKDSSISIHFNQHSEMWKLLSGRSIKNGISLKLRHE